MHSMINKAKKLAEEMAVQSGKMLLKTRASAKIVHQKDANDFVTSKDIAVEKAVIKQIQAHFPDHNILSEEIGRIDKKSTYTWVIDPLDGTKEYQMGLSNFSVCIMLESPKETLVSAVYIPATQELFSASKGHGAHQKSKQLCVSNRDSIAASFVVFHAPGQKNDAVVKKRTWDAIQSVDELAYKTFVRINDNMILCDLARGGYDGYVHISAQSTGWWDVAPGIMIAQEAGATVTDAKGEKLNNNQLSKGIVVSNGKIHNELIKLINRKFSNDRR